MKRLIIIAAIAVFAFHATPSCAAEDDATAREQFQAVLNAINQSSFEQVKSSIDKTDMTNRVNNLRPLENDTRIWFNENFWEVIESKFRGLMPEQNDMKEMELVDFRFENSKGSAVLRYRRPGYSYFYQRIDLRHDSRSRLKIVDVQRFNLRQSFIAEVGEFLVTRMPSRVATRNLLAKQGSTDQEVFQFTELLKAYRDQDTDRFFQIYDQMEAWLKSDMLLAKFAILTAYYGQYEKRMMGIFPEFFDTFKDDPKYSLFIAESFLIMGQYEKAYTSMLEFRRRYKIKEGAIPAQLSALALALGRIEDAEKHALEATRDEPTLELGWWSLLRASSSAGDYSAAIEALTSLEDNFDERLDASKLRRDKFGGFTGLAASQEFKDWRAGRD